MKTNIAKNIQNSIVRNMNEKLQIALKKFDLVEDVVWNDDKTSFLFIAKDKINQCYSLIHNWDRIDTIFSEINWHYLSEDWKNITATFVWDEWMWQLYRNGRESDCYEKITELQFGNWWEDFAFIGEYFDPDNNWDTRELVFNWKKIILEIDKWDYIDEVFSDWVLFKKWYSWNITRENRLYIWKRWTALLEWKSLVTWSKELLFKKHCYEERDWETECEDNWDGRLSICWTKYLRKLLLS